MEKATFSSLSPCPCSARAATKFIHEALLTCHTSAQVDARQGITEPRQIRVWMSGWTNMKHENLWNIQKEIKKFKYVQINSNSPLF